MILFPNVALMFKVNFYFTIFFLHFCFFFFLHFFFFSIFFRKQKNWKTLFFLDRVFLCVFYTIIFWSILDYSEMVSHKGSHSKNSH